MSLSQIHLLVALSMEPAPAGKAKTAHVIVLGNEKGGAGKSTMAINVIVALLKAGHSVASVDTDSRQRSLTRMIENRAALGAAERALARGPDPLRGQARPRRSWCARSRPTSSTDFADVIDQVEREFDFVVIDTPASDSYLMRISHSMADTLITPINDSFDRPRRPRPPRSRRLFGHRHQPLCRAGARSAAAAAPRRRRRDRLDRGPQPPGDALEPQPAARLRRARRARRRFSTSGLPAASPSASSFASCSRCGLTALDGLDRQTLGGEPTMSHVAGRQEIRELVDCLHLPGARRSALRAADAGPALRRADACRDAGGLKQLLPGFSVPH